MKILSTLCMFLGFGLFAQNTLYTNAILHIGDGTRIENGHLLVNDKGIIVSVGPGQGMAENATRINVKGKHIYPGMIAPNSTLGLQEIAAVRASRDLSEIGLFTPNVRAKVAFNTDSDILPTITCNGVLTAQITPRGGRISGTSSLMYLDERNWEEASVKSDEGIHFYLPGRYQRSGWWANPGPVVVNKKYQEQFDQIEAFLNEAKAYNEKEALEINISLAAMKDVFAGKQSVYLHSDHAQSFMDAALMLKGLGIEKLVWIGAYEADRVSDFLVANNIPVLLRRVHELPMFDDDDVDQPFKLAKTLSDKGILVALESSGDMEQINTRNLPYLAGTLLQYGWTEDEAYKLVSSNTAKILGIDDQLGTLAPGKHATFFISEGSIIDMISSQVESAYIKGRKLDFSKNKQWQLYQKYQSFYGEE